ncbi:ankyrin repeat-containing domain protein [Trichoderma sp. SZMC 28012]
MPTTSVPQFGHSQSGHSQSVAERSASLTRTGDDTWALAFEMARERENKLMLAYEQYLSSLQGDSAACGDISTPEFIKSVVERAIEDRERKRWRVSLLGTDIEVRAQAERLTKFLLWSESIVTAAVSNQPHAALAWSGVSLLLPLITRGFTQNEAMLKGFNWIGDVQMYWRICEETCPLSQNNLSYQEHLAKLYSYIIEYQARVICHLSKHLLSRGWNDIINTDEWNEKIQDIRQLDDECRNLLHITNADRIEKIWKQQLLEMQESRVFLDKIHNTLLESGAEAKKSYEDQKERALLQALASDYEGHKDFNPRKVEGTCEWFFADERFCNWRSSGASSLLWVSAGPGCGKSVLSRSLIDERRLSTNITTSTVCYFFFKDGDDSRKYAHNALCALLHQLFIHDSTGSLVAQALPSHKDFGDTLSHNFSELWKILVQCASLLNTREIICVIDALDECQEDSRKIFISELQQFYQSPAVSSKLKFLITSRPYDTIEASFKKLSGATSYLRFDGDDKSAEISHEINLVIDFTVNEIAQDFTEKDRRLISDRLKSMEHRTYLWLYLTLDVINKSPSEYGRRIDVEALLSSLPSEVSEAYEKILARSKRQDYTEALLHILLAATRPLTLDEANFALTVATAKQRFESHAALKDEAWPSAKFKDDVKNLCGLFIRVDDGKLSFIHQTARDFLTHRQSQGEWQGRFNDMLKSHSIMSSVCIEYLLLLPRVSIKGVPISSNGAGCQPFPLFSYAAKSWPLHFRSQEAVEASSWEGALTLCWETRTWGQFLDSVHVEWEDIWGLWVNLDFATKFGLVQQLLLKKGVSNVIARALLYDASRNGYKQIVQMVLDNGADVNDQNGLFGDAALQVASGAGHREIVQMLLGNGANVNQGVNNNGTALQAASYGGHGEIVRILLDNGADVHMTSHFNSVTALVDASRMGHRDIVQMLLDSGANVNQQGPGGTALQEAVIYGHGEIVQILLNNGANVNQQGYKGTPLQTASAKGYKQIAQMLLDSGANINQQGPGGTPLQEAANYGHGEIIKILLDNNADVDQQGPEGTALLTALARGYKQIAQMLLDSGANINQQGPGGTPLQAASKYGNREIVQMLLDNNTDINQQGPEGTALLTAIAAGRGEIIQMLLDNGADINMGVGDQGYTPLQVASQWHRIEIVQMLLDNGADINRRGGRFKGTALDIASQQGNEDMVKMLLDYGADVNIQGFGPAPLETTRSFFLGGRGIFPLGEIVVYRPIELS